MKHVLITCAVLAALASPAAADRFYESDIVDGVRTLVPRDADRLNEQGEIVQSRVVDQGFFSWPVATEKVEVDQATRPKQVSDCEGHDPEYRPAHGFRGVSAEDGREAGMTKAFIYDWSSYRNALAALDCTCGSLRADWTLTAPILSELTVGVTRTVIAGDVLSEVHSLIRDDYKRMCDVRMSLDLE